MTEGNTIDAFLTPRRLSTFPLSLSLTHVHMLDLAVTSVASIQDFLIYSGSYYLPFN